MKPLQKCTLVFALSLFWVALSAQVKFKVKLLPDNVTYQVSIKPDITWSAPFNATPSAQLTVVVPTGGFQVGTITNLKGNWSHNSTIVAPMENPSKDYIIFGLQGATSAITYQQNVEVALFNFTNSGTCTGALDLVETTDPFWPPNSQSANIGNQISTLGAGIGVNAFGGNFGSFSANCTSISNYCGIEIFDVAMNSPSACGVADGSIVISAAYTGPNPLPLQYTIDDGLNWQSSNTFTNLAAGDIFIIKVRDILPDCEVEVGEFELEGPLAAVVTGVDIVHPDCGDTNGSMTVFATANNGGVLNYGLSPIGPWQASNVLTGLAAGTYPLYVRNVTKNCESYIGDYTLNDCPPGPGCLITFELVNLGDNRYEVHMISDTTWNTPNDITSSLQITLKVPTGGFVFSNLMSEVTDVNWALSSTYTAPSEAPGFDYISIGLASPGTNDIPYVKGTNIPLFSFRNTGTCAGDSISLMQNDDAFYPPNSENANVGQQITVSGGGADIPFCISGTGSVPCVEPTPPVPTCLITYEIEKLVGDLFQVSMISDTTWTFPNNIVSSAQWTVKVPTGGFAVGNLTSLINNVNFDLGSSYLAPTEDPAHDYLSITLASAGTQNITFQKGVKVPLFTFVNSGSCQGGQVFLMDNGTDPFFPPNSQNANVGQQLTVSGFGGPDVPVCISNLPAGDCSDDPCLSLVAGFTGADDCENIAIDFTDTSTSGEAITSWTWDFGDLSAPSNAQHPSHAYSNSGNFEVSLTVTTGSGCEATFSEFVTVFPQPGEAPIDAFSICAGDTVQLQAPAGAVATWSPATGLSATNVSNPFAFPSVTTVYTLDLANDFGCINQDFVTVTVANKPVISNVAIVNQSDCGVQDGSISITAAGVGGIEYSINNGTTWSATPNFTSLAAGSYIILVRNNNGLCTTAWNGNPVTVTAPASPDLAGVTFLQPTGCMPDGSITFNATDGIAPLQYSIDGGVTFHTINVFQNLPGGTYTPIVTNADGSCEVLASDITLTQSPGPSVVTGVADFGVCIGSTSSVTIVLSENIASYIISGTGAFSNDATNGAELTFDVDPTGTVNYSVEMTGMSGCTTTETFTVNELPIPVAAYTISAPVCTNGEVTLHFTGSASPTANLTWSLSGGQVLFSSLANATDPAGATVVVKWNTPGLKNIQLAINDAGCQDTESSTLNITTFDPGATLAVTNVQTCGGSNGAIELNITGVGTYSYNWSGPSAGGSTQQDLTNLAAGNYFVTITETDSGCSSTASATLTAPQPVSINNVVPNAASDCSGSATDGSLTVQISGGNAPYLYELFATGNLNAPVETFNGNQTSITFAGLSAGSYVVEVTSFAGCTDTETTTIIANNADITTSISSLQNSACGSTNGSFTIALQGGQAPFTYDLYFDNLLVADEAPLNGQSLNHNNLAPGTYVAIFTDAIGCIAPVVVEIGSTPVSFAVTATETDPSCGSNDGSILLAGLPVGSTFSWLDTDGAPLASVNPLTDLSVGIYQLTVTGTNGCTAQFNYALTPTNGAQIAVSNPVSAPCGSDDGGFTFNVSGSNSFSYEILNSTLPVDFGDGGQNIEVTGLSAGAYVLAVTDLVTDCESVVPVLVSGSGDAFQVLGVVSAPTACGVEDASVCLNLSGGAAPYFINSTVGTFPLDPVASQGCIEGLYEGPIQITVTDANGCSVVLTDTLADQPDPMIVADDLTVTDNLCPDALSGSIISNTGIEYQIRDANNFVVGVTPLTQVPAGTYTVVYELGDCSSQISVTVAAPPAWDVQVTDTQGEGCAGDDGFITISAEGANGDYSFEWSNGDTGLTADSLSEGQYGVTVTDVFGCSTTLSALPIGITCIQEPCDPVFTVEVYNVTLHPGFVEVCLPTERPDFPIFDLYLNGEEYLRDIEQCIESNYFYDYGMLLNVGQPPFKLESWTYRGLKANPLQFTEISTLVDYMNSLDPTGNWTLDEAASSINGGAPNSTYGSLIINHLGSNTTFTFEVNTIAVAHPSIFVEGDIHSHILIVEDPDTGCKDTLLINLLQGAQPSADTVFVEISVGESEQVCVSLSELYGTAELLNNACVSFTNNAQLIASGTECFDVVGISEGPDQACMVICDDLGVCDTTIVIINVSDENNELVIYNGFSPNEDGVNDYFRIKNIEKYPANNLMVFNRWGNMVYSTKGYTNSNPWRGDYRSVHLPDASYFYMLNVEIEGRMQQFSGYVELRR